MPPKTLDLTSKVPNAPLDLSTLETKDEAKKTDSIKQDFSLPVSKSISKELESKDAGLVISDGSSALLHRAALIRLAQKSIDLQTYIFDEDTSSGLLSTELIKAANRGVKIRILVDDNGLKSNLNTLLKLNENPNIQVKIFNPFRFRSPLLRASIELPFDMKRINRRMHNKLFIVDDIAFIVGGRNIGDNYFDNSSYDFTDTDVLFMGKVALSAEDSFNKFWNFYKSVPINLVIKKTPKHKKLTNPYPLSKDDQAIYEEDLEEFYNNYLNNKLHFYFGKGIFVADDPSKVDTPLADTRMPILDLINLNLELAKKSVYISSGYLIPGKANLKLWKRLIDRGISFNILTNSLASIDVVPVYSFWERYRDKLVRDGANVYEYNYLESMYLNKKNKAQIRYKLKPFGKQAIYSGLHSKNIVIDDELSIVGSFNLDSRSWLYNTEAMMFFRSKGLADELQENIIDQMQSSMQIKCDKKSCYWLDLKTHKIYHSLPNASIWLRFWKDILKMAPEKLF
ncbi:phospholipase D family protein [Helicobacter sp. 13S00401-1]|uniref:phospholipase D family protein n=1 Tax=Helicobacter sp. 13S00401-1 TaxID=1905758 RepID=UPI0015562198|nr:phospholipase D family protein [Helicobacter sp. 13S00401-1]